MGPCGGPELCWGDIKQRLAGNGTNLGAQKLVLQVDQSVQGENWLFLCLRPWSPKVRPGWKNMVAHTPQVPDLVSLGGGPESAFLAHLREAWAGLVWGLPFEKRCSAQCSQQATLCLTRCLSEWAGRSGTPRHNGSCTLARGA